MRMLRWTNLLLAGSLLLVLGSAGCSSSSGVVTPAGPTSPTSPTSPTAPTGPVYAPSAQLFLPQSVHPGDTWMKASVPVQSGMTELWTVTDGTGTGAIASGQGTQVVGFRAGTGLGTFQVGADVQNQADASVSAAATVTVQTGTWLVEDGSPLLTRPNGTTTLLANGRVLVAGGTNGMNDSFNSAEIYDPGTRAWMATAPMGTGRQYQTATLLNDGTVLVTGGLSSFGGTALASAEIFNPNVVPATWTPAAPMAAARTGHLATLLKDGTVLVAGGGDGSGHGLASAEIYNPNVSPATWTTVAPMTTTRYLFTATLLADGTVLVAGGDSTGASAEIYDPNVSPATWTLVAPMTTVRSCPTATLLADGTVLVAGGYGSGSSILDSTEIYNPNVSPATWTLVAPMNTARSCHTATLLADGTVLVAGGCGSGSGSGSSILDSTEIYNPNVSPATWTVSAPMASVHYGHSATLLKDGTVLVAEGSPYSDPEIYDPNGTPGTWTSPVPPGAGNNGPTTTLLADGTVLASGGVDPSWNASTAAIIYDPSAPAQGWKAVAPMGTGRIRQAATRLNDGTVLVMGGASGYFGSVLNSAEVFNPAASPATWTAVAPMTTVRTSHTATLLADGTVLVAGGVGSGVLASAEIYDPKVSPATWTAAAPMNEARYGHTATLLADGTVLVAGGYAGGNLASAEIYNPNVSPATWTTVAPMNTARNGQTATLLADGTVLMVGGDAAGTSAEIYDPNVSPATWTMTAPMNVARTGQAATLLADGTVLVAGGDATGSAEIYDPNVSPATWSLTGSLNVARYSPSAILLGNGTVLLAFGAQSMATEIYAPAGYGNRP